MDELDRIPWRDLTHAYGSAKDVPGLLRALRTAPPDRPGEEGPLWQLFGNIWHQGTVYEATAYAVPFLIDIASDPRTPDRAGVLSLLAEIARSNSYRDIHGNWLKESDFDEKRRQKLVWVRAAHEAVASGFAAIVKLTSETTDVRYASAHVLAQLPEHAGEVAALLRGLLNREHRALYRGGLFLLLGQTGDRSDQTLSVLAGAANTTDTVERRAAALAIARMRCRPLPPGAREAMFETFTAENLEESFEGLPWDAGNEIPTEELLASFDAGDRERIAADLIAALESDQSNNRTVSAPVELLFPLAMKEPAPILTARDLTPLQARAVRALFQAMKGGRRIFYGHFPCWRLPDTMRDWRALADGRQPTPVDETLPLLARADRPRTELRPRHLNVGDSVIHRYFGKGIVTEIRGRGSFTEFIVRFDEEGLTTLSLPS